MRWGMLTGELRRLRAHFALGAAACVLLLGAACACQSDAAPEKARASVEPERFRFVVPDSYVQLELRGEGSERLRAPEGAQVSRSARGFAVAAGAEFALEVVPDAPPPEELTGPGVARLYAEGDTRIYRTRDGYAFLVTRELVPEWDDSTRLRYACGSSGGPLSGEGPRAEPRGYPRAAVERMVAACRTLELPRLE